MNKRRRKHKRKQQKRQSKSKRKAENRKQHFHSEAKRGISTWPIDLKICENCKEKKSIHNFLPDKRTASGLSNVCVSCKKKFSYGYSFSSRKKKSPQNTDKSIDEKECSKCGQTKKYSKFRFRNKQMEGFEGLYGQCKECQCKAEKEYREKRSPERIKQQKEYLINYRKTERGREVLRKGRQRYYQNNRDKFRARSAVTYAVLRGELPHVSTKTCRCGKQAENWHHHKGYEKEFWIDVEPVCKKCHYTLRERKASYRTEGERLKKKAEKHQPQ